MILFKVDPITFEKHAIPDEENKAYTELISKIDESIIDEIKTRQNNIHKLKEFNDFVYKSLVEDRLWESIPSDTRFPGYFSSLADHALATASIAVPLAVEVFRKGFDFASEYDNKELKEILSEKNGRGVVEVIRLLSLLHDVGKHPPREHYIRTREHVKKILDSVGLKIISETLAKSASRHHYRYDIDEEFKPKTKLEWIVAFADKISSTRKRGISGEFTRLLEPYKWLLEKDDSEKVRRIVEFIECIKSYNINKIENFINDELIYTTIPINFGKIKGIDNKIFNASRIVDDAKLGVLCIEVAGIGKFITASDYRKYISGASALIDDALNEAKKEIERMLCPECIVYAKGGSLLAIIPPSYFEEIKERICRIFEERTKVVNLKLPKSVEFELWELKYGPRIYKVEDADVETSLKLAEKRNFGGVVSLVVDSLETTEEAGDPEAIRVGEVCPVCHEYRRSECEHLIDDKKEKVCERCHLAIEEDKKLREEKEIIHINLEKEQPEVEVVAMESKPDVSYIRILRKVREVLKRKLRNNPIVAEFKLRGVNRINFAPVKTWDCIGRQHLGKDYSKECDEVYNIAFIKGDGDNFGKIKGSMPSITLYKQISKLFEDVIEGSIAEALSEVMIKQLEVRLKKDVKESLTLELPFDVVFVGGDDFLVLIDAAFIFVFLKAFRESLQRRLGERRDKFDKKENEPLSIIPLGVSMGVAVVKNRMPIKSILDVLDDLLRRSKQRSKSESDGFGGEIFVSMKKFESIPTKNEVEKAFNGTIKYTQFPMSGGELIDFIGDLKFFAQRDALPNWIRGVFGDLTRTYSMYENESSQHERRRIDGQGQIKNNSKSPIDSIVNLLYRMARTEKGSKEREMLEKIKRMHRDELKHIERGFVFKHIDIAESLEIVGGKLGLEGLSAKEVKEIMLKLLGDQDVEE